MNTRSVSILILGAAVGLLAGRPLAGASSPDAPVAMHIQAVTVVSNSGIRITRGAEYGDLLLDKQFHPLTCPKMS